MHAFCLLNEMPAQGDAPEAVNPNWLYGCDGFEREFHGDEPLPNTIAKWTRPVWMSTPRKPQLVSVCPSPLGARHQIVRAFRSPVGICSSEMATRRSRPRELDS